MKISILHGVLFVISNTLVGYTRHCHNRFELYGLEILRVRHALQRR